MCENVTLLEQQCIVSSQKLGCVGERLVEQEALESGKWTVENLIY